MHSRPLSAGMRHRAGFFIRSTVLAVATAALAACANPNFIGVQDYGYIVGNVVDQNSKPVAGALVSATGTTATSRTDQNGAFNVQNVAIGEQTVTIQAAGYSTGSATVIVVKNQGVTVPTVTITSTQPGT